MQAKSNLLKNILFPFQRHPLPGRRYFGVRFLFSFTVVSKPEIIRPIVSNRTRARESRTFEFGLEFEFEFEFELDFELDFELKTELDSKRN